MKATFSNLTGVSNVHLRNIVGTDEYRPSLQGIFVDLKNKVLVGTDAHIIVMYPIEILENEYPEDFTGKIVPLEYFNKSKYMGNWKHYIFSLTYVLDEDYARVFSGPEEVFKCRYINEQFPKYRNILLDNLSKNPIDEIGLDLRMMERLSKSIPRDSKQFKFTFFAKNKGVDLKEIDFEDNVIKGIIMPVMLR